MRKKYYGTYSKLNNRKGTKTMTFMPKENRILASLSKGEVPLGMEIYTGDPSMVEISAYAGFEFYMLDMEHSRINLETIEHCIRAADAAGITTVVKMAENNSTYIRQAIEAGALGIMVPHIKNRQDARKAIDSIRYPPEGKLGMCPAIRSANYSSPGWDDYLEHSSKNVMFIPILEDKEAIDDMEGIFAELKPGVDAVGFGRADLAQSVAKPGEKVDWNIPYVNEAYAKILAMSKKTGIPLVVAPWPEASVRCAKEAISKGGRIILYDIDQLLFYKVCLDVVKEMKK